MKAWKIAGIVFVSILLLIGLDFGTGYLGILKTKTVGKAKQNAQREVFEETQSYVQAKRQELVKLHHEWINADSDGKVAIENTIRFSFSNFDESKLSDTPELYNFLRRIKYN